MARRSSIRRTSRLRCLGRSTPSLPDQCCWASPYCSSGVSSSRTRLSGCGKRSHDETAVGLGIRAASTLIAVAFQERKLIVYLRRNLMPDNGLRFIIVHCHHSTFLDSTIPGRSGSRSCRRRAPIVGVLACGRDGFSSGGVAEPTITPPRSVHRRCPTSALVHPVRLFHRQTATRSSWK